MVDAERCPSCSGLWLLYSNPLHRIDLYRKETKDWTSTLGSDCNLHVILPVILPKQGHQAIIHKLIPLFDILMANTALKGVL